MKKSVKIFLRILTGVVVLAAIAFLLFVRVLPRAAERVPVPGSPEAAAETQPPEPTPEPTPPEEEKIALPPPIEAEGYKPLEVLLDGEPFAYAYTDGKEIYYDPVPLVEACGLAVTDCRCEDGVFTLTASDGSRMEASQGSFYMQVNGRYLYIPTDLLILEDRAFLPADATERIFQVGLIADEKAGSVSLDASDIAMIRGGEYYYDVTFPAEDVYWLSHLIQAEADTQCLAAQIGVGNVVLNRTKTEGFPDTVFKVVFDYQNAPQFSPKVSSAFSWKVADNVWVATCLCLEGYNTVGDALYFQHAYGAGVETNWIAWHRPYALTIGVIAFYY